MLFGESDGGPFGSHPDCPGAAGVEDGLYDTIMGEFVRRLDRRREPPRARKSSQTPDGLTLDTAVPGRVPGGE